MTLITELPPATPVPPLAATIGCFDGVHRGHRYLIAQVCREARRRGMRSALITFPEHPRKIMQSDFRPQLLCSPQQKTVLISRQEADYCLLFPFTTAVAQLSAFDFMQQLKQRFNVCVLVIGHDHRFGHNRSEGFEDYCRYGRELDMEIVRAEALTEDGTAISSSLIRHLLQHGEVAKANRYLGYAYELEGTVTTGHQVGRRLGFPTANLRLSCDDKLIPANGTYAVTAETGGQRYAAMMNIGFRPTIDNGNDRSLEVHLIDFSGNLYGQELKVQLTDYLRPEQKFGSTDELVRQLEQDRELARLKAAQAATDNAMKL